MYTKFVETILLTKRLNLTQVGQRKHPSKAINWVLLNEIFVRYRSGIICSHVQQQLPSGGIPRRPRGAVESMLDDALELCVPGLRRPANPLLMWCFLLAAGLLFYWFCVREGASRRPGNFFSSFFSVLSSCQAYVAPTTFLSGFGEIYSSYSY